MLKVYLNLDALTVGGTAFGAAPLGSVKLGDTFGLALYFTRGGVVQDLGTFDPALAFGVRAVGVPTQLLLANAFTKQTDLGYLGLVAFDTGPLEAAMGAAESLDCYGEFSFSLPAGEALRSLNWGLRVYRPVVTGGLTAPLAALSYPLPTELELLAHKGVANGYAGLGSDGKVGAGFLPTVARDAVFVTATAAQAVPVGFTNLTFDTVVFDTNTIWNAATPTRLVVKRAGVYLLCFNAYFTMPSPSVDEFCGAFLRVTSSYVGMQQWHQPAGSGQPAGASVAAVAQLSIGNYVEAMVHFPANAVTSNFSGSLPGLSMVQLA